MNQWAVTISQTVFVESDSAELAIVEGRKRVDAGEGSEAVTIEQMSE